MPLRPSSPTSPWALIVAAALVLPALPGAARAADFPMTPEEFGLWRDYQQALTDARVQKKAEKERLPAIAKNFGVPEKKLKDAVEKGTEHGEKMGKIAEEASRAALADTELAARIKEIRADTSAGHVVTYVTWTVANPEFIDREACLVATRVVKANALASTIKVDVLGAQGQKVFDALISKVNAGRIKEDSIVDFASTRYLKLFEKVKRAE